MLRTWEAPKIIVEEFVPHEYVSACGDTEYGVYKFTCNAPAGTLYYYDSTGSSNRLGDYTPCNETHEASVASEFPNGFVDRNRNMREDEGEAVVVWIERKWGYIVDAHATEVLDRDSWETTKS